MTPAWTKFLVHYHGCLDPLPDSPVHREFVDWALRGGIIRPHEGTFQTTALGSAWVKAMCAVPIPRVAYIGANGKEIK